MVKKKIYIQIIFIHFHIYIVQDKSIIKHITTQLNKRLNI